MDRIGFIGLGAMGHGMAKQILAKHGQLTVMGNRTRASAESLISHGAVEAKSAAALANASDVIFLCLPNSDIVERVIDNMGASLTSGKILIDTGTSSRQSTMVLA